MIKRAITETLHNLAKSYPVVTITGPRQSGKTTLARNVFSRKPYCNLENLDQRELADKDPRGFLSRFKNGAILDEIQRAPSLLSYIMTIVDEAQQPGMFVLTGSQNLNLLANITQSLAGRTAILKLLPFNFEETGSFDIPENIDNYLVTGFFPGIYDKRLNPTIAYRNYYETYIERDLRQLINVKDLKLFQTFVRLCAGRVGQLFNAAGIAAETGVSALTVKSWLSVMEASFIVFLLEPFYENINKRLVKSKKIYFSDVGLASYLLGIENPNHVISHPARGALFENMVIMELIKARYNRGLDHNLYFYRDSNGNEVDLIYKAGHRLIPIEIKSAATFNNEFIKMLHYIKKVVPDRVDKGYLIYGGRTEQTIHSNSIINYKNSRKIIL